MDTTEFTKVLNREPGSLILSSAGLFLRTVGECLLRWKDGWSLSENSPKLLRELSFPDGLCLWERNRLRSNLIHKMRL